jgi:hypothetical protein
MSDIQLFKRPPPYVGAKPFDGDLFEREALAARLTGYISRLKDGCVIGIDAPWGEGKSWFGRNWHAQLNKDGYQTVYLDAFENDFTEDPFLLIASELVAIAEKLKDTSAKSNIIDKAKAISKNIFPVGLKVAIGIAGRAALGAAATEEIKDIFNGTSEDIAQAVEKHVVKRLEDHDFNRRSVDSFRDTLKEFSAKQERPVIFFIDELDRCKPTFAVQVIERIKHFFDVPNLIFVLLLNRTQLEAAIKGVYGPLDAAAYMSKFVHFFLTLPKKASVLDGGQNYNSKYLYQLAARHAYDRRDIEPFVQSMSYFARLLGLSFRDLERSFILFGLAQPVAVSGDLIAYLIALRLGRNDIYMQLANGSKAAHEAALKVLNRPDLEADEVWIVPFLRLLHTAHLSDFKNVSKEDEEHLHKLISNSGLRINREGFIRWGIKRIDIQITD